jgi:hypothetical protein
MKCRPVFLLIIFFLVPNLAAASDLADLYDQNRLAREKPRFERRINEMFDKGIWPGLSENQKRALKSVEFEFPLVGEIGGSPMDYYSGQRGGRSFVAMPVLSLMFLEDLCIAYAWLHLKGYSLETIDEYITMLRYKKAADFPDGRYLPPLKALKIPPNALAERAVDDLSLRFRNTAYAFILLHEMGHVFYKHRGYKNITTAQARRNEQRVDQFALDVLQRTATIPMGAMLFFQAQAYFMPSKGQLLAEGKIQTEKQWQTYLRSEVTHPLTADRLRNMAVHMENGAQKVAAGSYRETLLYISTRLEHIAGILEDPGLQGCIAVVAHRAEPSILAPRRPHTMTSTLLEKWCGKKK